MFQSSRRSSSLLLSKIEGDFTCNITHPRHISLSIDDLEQGFTALSNSLPSILSQKAAITPAILSKLDKVMGPASLAEPFVRSWVSYINANYSARMKAVDRHFSPDISYATLATIPPPSSTFSSEKYDIRRATEENIEELTPLYRDFSREVWHPNHVVAVEVAVKALRQATGRKQLWFAYHNHPDQQDGSKTAAGFLLLGRETPRTIAIRNMFISPAFRRKGIAEALVRAATRFYLGAKPLGFDLQEPGSIHPKDEICLNVNDPGAKRLYIRCGFQFEGEHVDAVSKKKKWYSTATFEVEPIDKE
ncbi:hypothetical protein QCA50_003583 [Cerrena zonata]|uniref:N-acetyltransferase domain-containing protein n=1 Tax=Cerrena zonata TaxID=2478898 RepID=A0AAW0GQ27_9APHY